MTGVGVYLPVELHILVFAYREGAIYYYQLAYR